MSSSLSITPETHVGVIAVDHPLATRVFARHKIDFCCGGEKPIGEVCAKRGLDTQDIISQIKYELSSNDSSSECWADAPLEELIEHIVHTYHRSLDEELPRLEAMASKVNRVHGDKDPERLSSILSVFQSLKAELEEHMIKEEQILFPMILRGQGTNAQAPVSVMLHEHDQAGRALESLRELTDDYNPPTIACNTWAALYHGLGALETDLHQHIHLENNILFPRALQG